MIFTVVITATIVFVVIIIIVIIVIVFVVTRDGYSNSLSQGTPIATVCHKGTKESWKR